MTLPATTRAVNPIRTAADAGRLAGKIALVTGASRGIGQAIALRLARDGADVAVNFRTRAEDAERTVGRIEAEGRRALAVQANLARPDEIARMVDAVAEVFGALDLLICNAGAGVPGRLLDTTVKAWDLAMNVNARAYLLCVQAAVPLMQQREGGRIVALAAHLAVERCFEPYGPVAPSKAAVEALTTYLAVELGPRRITVNAVSPGFVDTEALAHYPDGREALREVIRRTPTGAATTPEDVAHLVAFLCSAEAGQISGQLIEIDGGYGRLLPLETTRAASIG